MKKSTKGAVAAGAAAVLLLGGAGSLAYWTDDTTVDGGTIEAGSITLDSMDCDGFVYDSDGTDVNLVVPGDVVTNDCDVTLVLEGDNIGATLQIDDASVAAATAALAADEALADSADAGLVPTVTLLDDNGDEITGPIEGAGTYDLTAQISVTFPYGGPVSSPDPRTDARNESQNGVAALDQLELIAVQTNVDLP